eukprot:TRINITY_DN1844_c0_g1_i4.p1 TRINITY_DN1844_c0_g1~~TRINITY_DN1844_c0_g1_i4.p1  ORF type:complete len:261 (+),score=34.30 TRINITY_DN1844_c0_g1_i4:102-884(+)
MHLDFERSPNMIKDEWFNLDQGHAKLRIKWQYRRPIPFDGLGSNTTANDSFLKNYGEPMTALPLRVKTGDVVLFSFASVNTIVTKIATSSMWTHSAIVYLTCTGRLLLLESSSEGVQKYLMEKRIENMMKKGITIGIVRLEGKLVVGADYDLLSSFIESVIDRPYEKSFLELMRSAAGHDSVVLSNKEEDLSSIFCSELTAACLQQIGVLPKDRACNSYTPASFDAPNLTCVEPSSLAPARTFKRKDAITRINTTHRKNS